MIDNIKMSQIIRPLSDNPDHVNNLIRCLNYIENKDEVFEYTISEQSLNCLDVLCTSIKQFIKHFSEQNSFDLVKKLLDQLDTLYSVLDLESIQKAKEDAVQEVTDFMQHKIGSALRTLEEQLKHKELSKDALRELLLSAIYLKHFEKHKGAYFNEFKYSTSGVLQEIHRLCKLHLVDQIAKQEVSFRECVAYLNIMGRLAQQFNKIQQLISLYDQCF